MLEIGLIESSGWIRAQRPVIEDSPARCRRMTAGLEPYRLDRRAPKGIEEYPLHLKSWLIGMRSVFANFTMVVRRRSFSPRSIAPANERARPPSWARSS